MTTLSQTTPEEIASQWATTLNRGSDHTIKAALNTTTTPVGILSETTDATEPAKALTPWEEAVNRGRVK